MSRYKQVCTYLSHVQHCIYHARVWYCYISMYRYIPLYAGHDPEQLSWNLSYAVCIWTKNPVLCTNCLFLRKHEILRIVTNSTYWFVRKRAVLYYSMVHTGLKCVCTRLYFACTRMYLAHNTYQVCYGMYYVQVCTGYVSVYTCALHYRISWSTVCCKHAGVRSPAAA